MVNTISTQWQLVMAGEEKVTGGDTFALVPLS